MDWFLIILAFVLMFAGLLGAVVPALPGPPLSFIALVVAGSSRFAGFETNLYIVTAVVAIVIVVLDYLIPIYGTRWLGGTKAGMRGSTIGLVVAVFLLPFFGIVVGPFGLFGMLLGPFAGAYLGERMAGTDERLAWRSAIGSFVGFLAGTFLKLAYSIVLLIILIRELMV